MDGHTQQTTQDTNVAQDSAPLMPEPIADGSLGSSAGTPFFPPTDDTSTPATEPQTADTPTEEPLKDVGAPTEPTSDGLVSDTAASTDDIAAVYADQGTSESATSDTSSDNDSSESSDAPVSGELLTIKQQALEELSPLVGQLDQPPEEKFRTTMMLIQASDNQSLIQAAYDAAKAITDEKVRAQALLDVVNEINYFTHNKKD